MKTVVEERAGVAPGTPDQVVSRLLAAIPKARELPGGGDRIRFAVPLNRTGLSQAVMTSCSGQPLPPGKVDWACRSICTDTARNAC